ncbi:helix-turn-helix transcriptional regulator [Rhodoferax sp.]
MKVDPEVIRKLREERAWSQEHLAAVTGLSLRTIQRVESEANASAETRMSLAAAFGVDLARLSPPPPVAAPVLPSSSLPTSLGVVSSGPPESAPMLSYLHYRLLRFAVIVGLLVGLDVCQSGRVTWSRWVFIFGAVLMLLRAIKSRFVGPRLLPGRRSAERNV